MVSVVFFLASLEQHAVKCTLQMTSRYLERDKKASVVLSQGNVDLARTRFQT